MKYVLIAVVALVLGLGIGWVVWNSSAGLAEPAARLTSRAPEAESPPASSDTRDPDRAPLPATSEPTPRAEAGLISAELNRYAHDEITAGWQELRKDPIPDALREKGYQEFEEVVKTTPRKIGRELAGHQDNVDALASGNLISILRALDKDSLGPQLDMVRNADRFHSFFQCSGGESFDGPKALGTAELQLSDSATLTFGAGAHVVPWDWMRRMKSLPNCITMEGAGRDQTLLVMDSLSTGTAIDRLTIRNLTVYTSNRYLFDLRTEPAVLRLDRVRFCGFDSGGGSSCLLGTLGTAILATDCRFEGGYGRSPALGNLCDIRSDAVLARFEGCVFSRISIQPGWLRAGATVIFSRCTFENLFDSEQYIRRAKSGVVFDQCSITYAAPTDPALPALDLNDLFPNWRAQIGR